MIVSDLFESSPDTPAGSRSQDLNLGKLWLCRTLKRLGHDDFDNVYVLGSWYGSMAQYILERNIACNKLFLIDIDPENTQYAQENALSDKVVPVTQDCNTVAFEDDDSLVINTSTNDIKGSTWFDNIPNGTIVALQGRDQQRGNKENLYQTLSVFDEAYPLVETYCLKQMPLECMEGTQYNRFMKIGLK
jgi:hypothetical protein